MATHRRGMRRGTETRRVGSGSAQDALSPRRLALDEATEQAPGEPGEPAGFGTEASRSAQNFAALDSYEVPEGRTARLVEASVSLEANSEARISVNGVVYGSYTGAVDVALPFDGAFLMPGDVVSIQHQSTDGNSQTTRASLTVKEV